MREFHSAQDIDAELMGQANTYRKTALTTMIEMQEEFACYTMDNPDVPEYGHPGDFLVVGIKGEVYPCNKEVKEKTYVLAEDGSADIESVVEAITNYFTAKANVSLSGGFYGQEALGKAEQELVQLVPGINKDYLMFG